MFNIYPPSALLDPMETPIISISHTPHLTPTPSPLILPQKRRQQQLIRTRPLLMIILKRHRQKRLPLLARVLGRARFRAAVADLEDGLELVEVGEGVRAREHLHDEAAEGPDVRFAGVGSLFDDLGGHPED